MTVQHPIITYRLRSNGTIPPFLCDEPGSFAGMYGVNTNKEGYIPAWLPPQETKYLGMACGPVDPDGCPSCVDVIETKQELEDYITSISTTWTVDTQGVTGIRTETTTGTLEAWNPPSQGIGMDGEVGAAYTGPGLTTTTTAQVTFGAPSGTVIEHTAEYVTKIVVETSSSAGVTTSVQEFDIVHPYTNITITGTTETVGVVTTSGPGLGEGEEITTTTTTTRTQATHLDVTEGYSDSITTTDVDGEVTKTRVRTYREVTKVRNPFDPVAATNELWTKYETVNGL
jgi:hypothetical protein